MRLASLVIPLMLCSCDSAQSQAVQACEVFIKERLRSPSTYKRISGDSLGPAFESDGRRVKMVTLEYDAANAYGTPIRGIQQCVFEVNANGTFKEDIEHAARMSSIGADSEYAPCCLLDRDGTALAPSSDDLMLDADTAGNVVDAAENGAVAVQR
jgi:hypothetical protein